MSQPKSGYIQKQCESYKNRIEILSKEYREGDITPEDAVTHFAVLASQCLLALEDALTNAGGAQ